MRKERSQEIGVDGLVLLETMGRMGAPHPQFSYALSLLVSIQAQQGPGWWCLMVQISSPRLESVEFVPCLDCYV